MAMMIEFGMDEKLEKEFKENKSEKTLRWLKVLIKDEKLVGDGTGKATEDPKADVKGLQDTMAADDEPFYGVVRATDDGEWIVLAYIPDSSKVKARMQYASTLLHLKKKLGNAVIGDERITTKDEVSWATVEETLAKKKGRVDNSDAMTAAEKQKQEIDEQIEKEVTTAVTGASGSAHTVKFPMEDAAKEALKAVGEGEVAAAVVKTDGEKLVLCDKFADGTALDKVVGTLEKESRFVVYNHTHEDKRKTVFIYYASDQCPVKKRMLYASSKAAVVEYASDAGCELAKTFEFTETGEVTVAALDDGLKPAAETDEPQVERKTKPKPPGKGHRMLI